MKLATFNIRCDYEQDQEQNFQYRKPYILKQIAKEQPDVICFQEVLLHVAEWMKQVLTDYYVIGCGREKDLGGEQETIAYRKENLNLLAMDTYWLSETPRIPGSRYPEQSLCPRVCTEAVFQHKKEGWLFRTVNIHLDHEGSRARMKALKQILKQVRNAADFSGIPVILAGDFNAFPDSEEMKIMEDYPEFRDAAQNAGGTFHDYGRLCEPEKIDYIFLDQRFLVKQVSRWDLCTDGIYLSDHYPVCVEMCTQ